MDVNRKRWDETALLHETSYFAPDAQAQLGMGAFESEELGLLVGQRICHLQCHLGTETRQLAALAATVVGVDFSASALAAAARLTEDGAISYVCATVAEAATATGGGFDGVYTSWGVLMWNPSIQGWAASAAALLRPGGWLYLAEIHPYAMASRWPGYPYGGGTEHFGDSEGGDYSDPEAVIVNVATYEWTHGVGDVVTALAGVGFCVEFVHEHPIAPWNMEDASMGRRPDGWWEVPDSDLPLSYSLRATLGGGLSAARGR
jgi:SAM-dependent methyltransferase